MLLTHTSQSGLAKGSGGLIKGGITIRKSNFTNPLRSQHGGLGGDSTYRKLKPWIRGEISGFEAGEKEWERNARDRLNEEALGSDSDFSSPASIIHSDSESDETKQAVLQRIHDKDGDETDASVDSPRDMTQDIFKIFNATPRTEKAVRDALAKETPKEKLTQDLRKSLTKLRKSNSLAREKPLSARKSRPHRGRTHNRGRTPRSSTRLPARALRSEFNPSPVHLSPFSNFPDFSRIANNRESFGGGERFF